MASWLLTPNTADPLTGLQNALMGWHFVGASALDVFTSFAYLVRAGWDYQLFKDPDNPALQRLSMVKAVGAANVPVQFVAMDTDWYGLDDHGMVHVLSEPVVTQRFTVAAYTPPGPVQTVAPSGLSSAEVVGVQTVADG